MLEKLKAKRDALALEMQGVENENLDSLIAEKLEALKAQAIKEANEEHQAKLDEYKVKIGHYDYVINVLESEEPNEVVEVEA